MTEKETAERQGFRAFALAPDVFVVLDRLGLVEPTPIQEKVIGPILEGADVVGKAETGTGKTIGFGAPLVGRIDTARVAVQALVLTPTRELAQQVAGVMEDLGAERSLGVALLVGGVHASGQIEHMRSGTQVVVGTPGRILDFLRERILSLAWCETVVLDEADRMLDMGFIEDVSKILEKTPPDRQTLLFSATLPPEIQKLLDLYMRDPQIYSTASGLATVPDIRQTWRRAEFPAKFRELRKILDSHPDETAIIFCNTRRQAIDLDRMMWGHGYSAGALHGDQDQDARFRVLKAFRAGEIRILVATDVASRGLDIEAVGRVINYEVPEEAEAYVHRIGRTGRASHSGEAITLVASKERRRWNNVLDNVQFPIERSGGERDASAGRGRRAGRSAADSDDRSGEERSHGRRGGRRGRASGRSGQEARGGGGRQRSSGPRAERSDPAAAAPAGESGETARASEGGGEAAEGNAREPSRPRRGRRPRRAEADDGLPRGGERSGGGESGERDRPSGREGRSSERGRRSESSEPARESARPRPSAPRPEKVKLDLIDDDFIKTDYFDVDPSVARTSRSRSAPQGRRGGGSSSSGSSSGSSSSSRQSSRRSSRRSASSSRSGARETRNRSSEGDEKGASTRRRRRRPRRRRKPTEGGGGGD